MAKISREQAERRRFENMEKKHIGILSNDSTKSRESKIQTIKKNCPKDVKFSDYLKQLEEIEQRNQKKV